LKIIIVSTAQDLVIGHTEYEYDAATELWAQPEYTAALLRRTSRANSSVLETLTLSRDHRLSGLEFNANRPLSTLIDAGARDSSIAYDVFRTLLDELSTPAINRPPVLFALDNLNHISLTSAYCDADFNPIHAHDLAIPRIFLSFLNGSRKFERGLVVAATSSQSPRTDALAYALCNEPLPDYSKLDTKVAPSVAGAKVVKLGAMQMDEASSLLEYCKNSGLLNETLDQETVAQRFALSSGVAGEIVKGCVRIRA
jgi:small subunit ribosomal protein S29